MAPAEDTDVQVLPPPPNHFLIVVQSVEKGVEGASGTEGVISVHSLR